MSNKMLNHIKRRTFIKTSIRFTVRNLVQRSLFLKKSIKRLNKYYLESKGKLTREIIAKPFEVVIVPTDSIKYFAASQNLRRSEYFDTRLVGIIANGDWDIHNNDMFKESSAYSDFYKRFSEGNKWEETNYYQLFEEKLYSNKVGWRKCKTWAEFKAKKLREWDELYRQIEKKGYINQTEPEREVEVGVSRNGEILFVDGRHRLSIAKILNINEIPVIVNMWHKEYIEEAEKILDKKNLTPKEAIKPALKNLLRTKI